MAMAKTLREALEQEQADHAETRKEMAQVQDVVLRHHEDAHGGVYRYCDNPVCRLVSTLDYDPDIRHHL
jgi:hypothetical protein